MNRIYQGRVTKVQFLKEGTKNEWTEPQADLTALWEHHELFQDAVNYYLVCLLALAGDECKAQKELREKLVIEPTSEKDNPLFVWGSFRRRGATRQGLRESVKKYLCPGKETPTWDECAAAVLEGNPHAESDEGRTLLDRGLRQLLDKCKTSSGIKQAAPVFQPRYCSPSYKGNYGADSTTLNREVEKALLPHVVHAADTTHESEELNAFTVHSIALPNAKEPEFTGAKALSKLKGMLQELKALFEPDDEQWDRLSAKLGELPATLSIPGYAPTAAKGVIKHQLFAMFFFKHVEKSSFTLELLRQFTRKPKEGEKRPEAKAAAATDGDPIRLARGQRGYVFRAFTSLPQWTTANDGVCDWTPFDFAAFEEALKALHQVDEKAVERANKWEALNTRHKYQRDGTKKWKGATGGEEDTRPPVLNGDPRIARLEQLVDVEMKEEYEMAEGVSVKYGLQQRTIRGFRDLRKKWNDAIKDEPAYSAGGAARVLERLRDYQKENPTIVGSVRLFEEMLREPNWLIWREPTADEMKQWRSDAGLPDDVEFAKDPLQALTDERELKEEMDRLKEPIRLTPADPVHSRRQFYFSDTTNLKAENRLNHHQGYVETELAIHEQGRWQKRWARLHFSAPRLQRDQITATEKSVESRWQQSMMAALGIQTGLSKDGKPTSFERCVAVALMPEQRDDGSNRHLLNFPIELDGDAIAKQVGKAQRWDANQFGPNFKNASWLRWPSTPDKNQRSEPWWQSGKPFSCLSIDLGQRDTAAYALILASPGDAPKSISRWLGEAGGKTWWATAKAKGMMRLPGEDAQVLREGQWQEEFSGEKGRLQSAEEWKEAQDICARLGLVADEILGTDASKHSFPECNDRLLYALRRAQSRLARMQSWSCLEKDEKRRPRIVEQILEAAGEQDQAPPDGKPAPAKEPLLVELKAALEKQQWAVAAQTLINEANRLRELICREMVLIADRIQPLRGRKWEWALRDDGSGCHVLRQTQRGTDDRKKRLAGQRGLSMERLEQLESLRQRCQSLNRALRQTPGEPARLGRSKRGIELPDPCPELLERLDALKEQRVNQTAHLILAQALGVRLKAHSLTDEERQQRDIHGEYQRIPGREPVDFVVIENLDRYLASQGRSRGENSRLMKWCHGQIRDKLVQLCEVYGLAVLETPAAYSSRFCSLTGVAGFRAVELHPEHKDDYRWKKHLERLADPDRAKKLSTEERKESEWVKTLFDALDKLNVCVKEKSPLRPQWRTLLAPVAGGPVFVPMKGKPIQADMNAAINLGLRAMASPEAADIHLRIRAERKGDGFVVRAENIREKAQWGDKPPAIEVGNDADRKKLLEDARLNFFKDVGAVATFDKAKVSNKHGYASGRGLWGSINQKDFLRCGTLNNDRLAAAGLGRPLKEEDEIP
jgi:hypothetical protein